MLCVVTLSVCLSVLVFRLFTLWVCFCIQVCVFLFLFILFFFSFSDCLYKSPELLLHPFPPWNTFHFPSLSSSFISFPLLLPLSLLFLPSSSNFLFFLSPPFSFSSLSFFSFLPPLSVLTPPYLPCISCSFSAFHFLSFPSLPFFFFLSLIFLFFTSLTIFLSFPIPMSFLYLSSLLLFVFSLFGMIPLFPSPPSSHFLFFFLFVLFLCPLSSSSSSLEDSSSLYLMVPKPLDSFNLLRVKGKGLKQKVLHASCEWYAVKTETRCRSSSSST